MSQLVCQDAKVTVSLAFLSLEGGEGYGNSTLAGDYLFPGMTEGADEVGATTKILGGYQTSYHSVKFINQQQM